MSGSIRRRLVASYVLLTLVTAAAIGFLAIGLIDHYVARQEEEYLSANAEAIARQSRLYMRPFVMLPALQQLAQSASFLGNVRVRILDSERAALADSGARLEAQEVAWVIESVHAADAGEPPVVSFRVMAVGAEPLVMREPGAFAWSTPISPTHSYPARAAEGATFMSPADVIVVQRSPSVWGDRLTFEPVPGKPDLSEAAVAAAPHPAGMRSLIEARAMRLPEQALVTGWFTSAVTATIGATAALPLPVGAIAIAPDETNMGEAHTDEASGETSADTKVVTAPIFDGSEVVGYVELRRIGGYAEESLPAIRRAFAVASGGALVLASVLGLVVSRGLTAPVHSLANAAARMRAGDLTARAPIHSRDELGALADQFNQMAERLQESFRQLAAERDTLRRFVADASHELRTPITALRTFIELLQGNAGRDARTQREFLQESMEQVVRLEWITRNLLDLSRLDAGLAALDLQCHDAAELLAAAVSPFRVAAQERAIDLRLETAPQESALVCDGQWIERALCNLLDNALKFTPPGGRITARFWCASGEKGTAIAFEVEDTGVGIDAAELPHIFERFHRGPKHSSQADPPGSGLGLAIVQSVAQAHNGQVEVVSEVGKGSRFVLRLPTEPT